MIRFLIGFVALIACIDVALPEPEEVKEPEVTAPVSWPPVRVVPLPAPEVQAAPTTSTVTITAPTLPALVGPDTPCQEWVDTALAVGWPADREVMERMLSIMWRESRCTTDAFKSDDPNGGSAGLMQINFFWCKPRWAGDPGWLQLNDIIPACGLLMDGEANLRSALAIWNYGVDRYGDGWGPWKV